MVLWKETCCRRGLIALVCVLLVCALATSAQAEKLRVSKKENASELWLEGKPRPFYKTANPIVDAESAQVGFTGTTVAWWQEELAPGRYQDYYALDLAGSAGPIVRPTSHRLRLNLASFDPLIETPGVPAALRADAVNRTLIVQFWTQPIEAYRTELQRYGARVLGYIPNNAIVVRAGKPRTLEGIEQLPFVRWVGRHHPAYRLERYLVEHFDELPTHAYTVVLWDSDVGSQQRAVGRIRALGGSVNRSNPGDRYLDVSLTPDQLLSVANLDDVAFVSRTFPPTPAGDIAREIGGATYVQLLPVPGIPGFAGQGVRGEVIDIGDPELTHQAFQAIPPIPHAPEGSTESHATSTYGIIFGDGTGAADPDVKGVIPQAQGIYSGTDGYFNNPMSHTCQMTTENELNCNCEADPNCPYDAVFSSNSWEQGAGTEYTAISQQDDEVTFLFDFLSAWAQGNCGNPDTILPGCETCSSSSCSNLHAWAKNTVAVGGVIHENTLDKIDDHWKGGGVGKWASSGPASDGRVKPDFTHFFDQVETTKLGSTYGNFSGTSAATPIVAGYFGILAQMWGEGVFGNTLRFPDCDPATESCVFLNRPHLSTAKAMMINTADQYFFDSASIDLTRDHQGWGMPNVARAYLLRNRFEVLIDGDQLLDLDPITIGVSESVQYTASVESGALELRVTLAYTDPEPASPSGAALVNDLTLKVTPPSGTSCYFGNHGLVATNCPSPAGLCPTVWSMASQQCDISISTETDTIDNVENVFIENPEPGTWTVEVTAVQINDDGHVIYVNDDPSECVPGPAGSPPGAGPPGFGCVVQSPMDADFSLVVSVEPDCNGNLESDIVELTRDGATATDCNMNAVLDECDITSGFSADTDADGVPDECRPRRSRFLGVRPPQHGQQVALRVTPSSLPDDFSAFNGIPLWVGPSVWVPDENMGDPLRTVLVAPLQCSPHYQVWDAAETIYVYGAEVVPGAAYEVCEREETTGALMCAAAYQTGKWGDVVELFDDPANPPQPDFHDIAAVVAKFKATPTSPSKVDAQLQPNTAIPTRLVSFSDVAAAVSAFTGTAYADELFATGPCTCPSDVTCGATGCVNDFDCNDGFCIDDFCTDSCGRCTP